jgi:hypothetical protein
METRFRRASKPTFDDEFIATGNLADGDDSARKHNAVMMAENALHQRGQRFVSMLPGRARRRLQSSLDRLDHSEQKQTGTQPSIN